MAWPCAQGKTLAVKSGHSAWITSKMVLSQALPRPFGRKKLDDITEKIKQFNIADIARLLSILMLTLSLPSKCTVIFSQLLQELIFLHCSYTNKR